MSQAAVDDLIALARPRGHRGQHLPGHQPRRRAPAGVRRPGRRPGAGGRGPHRRRRPPASTRCTPTSCAPATRRCRSSTRSTASATAARSPPAGSSPSSTARPSSTCRRRSTSPRTGFDHRGADAARRAGRARDAARLQRAVGAVRPRRCGDWYDRDRPDRHPQRRLEPARPRRSPLPPAPAGVAAGRRRRCPTTRCCTPASSPTPRT